MWHQLPLQNSIIEITEKSVEIWHVEDGKLAKDGYVEFNDDGDWVHQLLNLLQQNSERGKSA